MIALLLASGFLGDVWSFTQDNFEAELPNIAQGGVASHEYTLEEAQAAIKANMK